MQEKEIVCERILRSLDMCNVKETKDSVYHFMTKREGDFLKTSAFLNIGFIFVVLIVHSYFLFHHDSILVGFVF